MAKKKARRTRSTGPRNNAEDQEAAVKLTQREPISRVAPRFGVSAETVCNWVAHASGFENAQEMRAKTGKPIPNPMAKKPGINTGINATKTAKPVPVAAKPATKAKELVVIERYECPHCGGPIDF